MEKHPFPRIGLERLKPYYILDQQKLFQFEGQDPQVGGQCAIPAPAQLLLIKFGPKLINIGG